MNHLRPVVLLLLAGCSRLQAPLRVGPRGVLLRDGKPFHAIGVNYFGCFARTLRDPADRSYEQGFAELARRGIPFCRFMACGFWPKDWEIYLRDRERYFALLDRVVRAAERHGIGLIPSLFWHSATVPDIVGEPRNQWGNPRSKTHAFMRRYVREVVTRYRGSPAIWGWEFGNEYNLAADLPNAARHRPKVVPRLGTPTRRSAADDLSHRDIEVAFAEFAREVRRYDPIRPLLTGNSAPRPSAWHQWKEKTWAQDAESQFAERLLRDNPDPVDTITVHIYWDRQRRFGREVGVEEFLRLANQIARRAGKVLFVGEFGACEPGANGEAIARKRFARILEAIRRTGVPLAALWVFDYRGQSATWNVTPTNPRSYQLEAIATKKP